MGSRVARSSSPDGKRLEQCQHVVCDMCPPDMEAFYDGSCCPGCRYKQMPVARFERIARGVAQRLSMVWVRHFDDESCEEVPTDDPCLWQELCERDSSCANWRNARGSRNAVKPRVSRNAVKPRVARSSTWNNHAMCPESEPLPGTMCLYWTGFNSACKYGTVTATCDAQQLGDVGRW